jgi:hypothetical protein
MSGNIEKGYHFHYVPSDEKYEHHPLISASHVRLLILRPLAVDEDCHNNSEAPLMGTMFQEEISPEAEYILLCPVPDSNPPTKALETPEGSIAITPALHNAISALSRLSDTYIKLWTSAISIDTSNESERQNQFRDMEKIYINAKQVIAFLGAEDDDTADAHDLFQTLARLDVSTPPTRLEELETIGLPPITSEAWGAIDRFLSKPWFRSIQALPACVWAKQLQFTGENWSLGADMFVAAMLTITALSLPLLGHRHNSDELADGAKCFSLFALLRAESQRGMRFGKRFGISKLLDGCRSAMADTPLEKLSIIAAVSNKGPDELLWTRGSDISDDIKECLRIARFYFDNSTDAVELLAQGRGCINGTGTPSWMLHLSKLKRYWPELYRADFRTATLDGLHKPVASGQARDLAVYCSPVPCSCPDHNAIAACTRDTRQGQADNERPSIVSLISHWQHANSLFGALRSETKEPLTTYPGSSEPVLEAMWETLRKGKPSDPKPSQSMESAKAIFLAVSTDDMVPIITLHFEKSKPALEGLADELSGWKFCVTATGYMALVPEEAEVGDVIMVVYGARVPFVFRPVPGTENYRMVGECYVHGIMNGELLLPGKLQFETRILV